MAAVGGTLGGVEQQVHVVGVVAYEAGEEEQNYAREAAYRHAAS